MSANKSNEELVDEFYEALNSAEVSPEELKKQHALGKRSARERVATLVDFSSFQETGALVQPERDLDQGSGVRGTVVVFWWASCATNVPPLPVTCPLCREEWTLDDFDCNC